MRYIINSNGELLAKAKGSYLQANTQLGEFIFESNYDAPVLSLFKYKNGEIVKKTSKEIQMLEQRRKKEQKQKQSTNKE